MEYRLLPHGNENEKFSVLGLGMGGIGKTSPDEIEKIIRKAIENGINFFDLCTAGATYAPVGRAIKDRREKVFLQVHFGAVYDENGEYGWCRDFETIKSTFLAVLRYTMFWQSIPFLDLIFIIDEYRNKGYGRKMMNYWEEKMKLLGYKYVMTSTQADETAFAFYERLGYEKTGAFYPPDQTAEELIYLKGI